jgi:hypothetical protein
MASEPTKASIQDTSNGNVPKNLVNLLYVGVPAGQPD